MDIIRLYEDFRVDYLTEGNKHCTPGWVNTHCPFCEGSKNYHLGFNIQNEFFVCWRCGWKPTIKTIAKLIHVAENEAKEVIKSYGGKTPITKNQNYKIQINKKRFKYPTNTTALATQHKAYLKKRGLDPEKLEKTWGIMGTGPISKLDNIDYKNRILIPIYWQGEVVSFQTRDITGNHPIKYMACPEEREKIKHKHILYGHPSVWEKESCICVEGVFDAWRLGKRAVATFGIKYKIQQINVLAKTFKKVTVLFDTDPQAVEQAKKLVSELRFRGVEAYCVSFEIEDGKDPADLSENEAKQLVRKLRLKKMI